MGRLRHTVVFICNSSYSIRYGGGKWGEGLDPRLGCKGLKAQPLTWGE